MVMATHDGELVPLLCDRVAVMKQGRIVRHGSPQQIFDYSDMLRKARLRLPRIAHLAEILDKEDGLHLANMPLTIGQARRELVAFLGTRSVRNGSAVYRSQE